MILGNFNTGADYVGAGNASPMGAGTGAWRRALASQGLPIASPKLPRFSIFSTSRVASKLDRNEQSTGASAVAIQADAAAKAVLKRAHAVPMSVQSAGETNFLPAIFGRGPYVTGSVASVAARINPRPMRDDVIRSVGPGLTPASPFVYGERAGVGVRLPAMVKGTRSPIVGSVKVVGNPSRHSIFRGE